MSKKQKRFVVTAFAEPCAGPGWANSPVWVILSDEEGRLYRECIQPDDQSAVMRTLYSVSASTHVQMSKEAEKIKW